MDSNTKTTTNTNTNVVILAMDATRERNEDELRFTLNSIRMRGDILCSTRNLLIVFGVLHTVTNPMGYPMKASTDSFLGTSSRLLEEEVLKKIDNYESMLLEIAEKCKEERVIMKVKITAGTPTKVVILQEVLSCKATWVILDRHLRRDLKFYVENIPCKVALIQDSLSVEVPKAIFTNTSSNYVSGQKFIYSTERSVLPKAHLQEAGDNEQLCGTFSAFSTVDNSVISGSFGTSSSYRPHELNDRVYDVNEFSYKQSEKPSKGDYKRLSGPQVADNLKSTGYKCDSSEKPILCAVCGLRSVLYIKDAMKFKFSEIQNATSNFSKESFLGEGGFGIVYKGKLQDGQTIAAKVRKEASEQGYSEFFSEVQVLSFARHRNIVMLLGYCSKEKNNILVYEYICNKSLEWHLFSESANLLEWHKRHAIAIAVAKGLRFLHEECRGGPIIHRDLRPSNILLTHDFVPMLADFGLAKWKASNESFHTRVLGTSGYLAPEYAENGIVSVRTDVYAFGIILFQLISGGKILDESQDHSQHILERAEPLVEKLALHKLVDPRLGDSYDTYELYHLARVAFLCVRRNPEMRPSMGEVLHLLEINNDHTRDFAQQFAPHFTE